LVAFTGVADDGIFLVTDSDLHITNFSFSARLTLLDDYVLALLPSHLKTDDAVFHVRVYDDQLFAVQRCRLEN